MDLSTTYLGIELPHPFMAGAAPLSDGADGARRLEDAGAAGIVLPSLFEEEIQNEALATSSSMDDYAESHGEAQSYFADPEEFVIGPENYLERLRQVKEAVSCPVFASLNGFTQGGWLEYARLVEAAGADALELNLFNVPMDASVTSAVVEEEAERMVQSVRLAVRMPLAVKLSPFYTSLANFASRLSGAGADGLVLFNRFFETDIDIEELELISRLQLSDSRELLLRLRWLSILSGTVKDCDLAVTGGVHTVEDAIKAVMCGASVIQMVSSLFQQGVGHLARVREEMVQWLEEKEYESLSQMRGSMNLSSCPDPRVLSRVNYMHQLRTWQGMPA